jgi:DNA-binding beta-propeller fold protein YncE
MCLSVAFSPDSRTLGVGRRDGHVLLLGVPDSETKVKCRLEGPFSDLPIWDMLFSPDGNRLFARAALQSSYRLVFWDLDTGARHFPQPDLAFYGLALSSDGTTLAVSDYQGKVHLLEAASGTRQTTLDFRDKPREITFVPETRTLACCVGGNPRVSLIDVGTRQVVRDYPEPDCKPGMHAWHLVFTPDGRTLITSNQSILHGRDVPSGSLTRLEFPGESICALSMSPTGNQVAVSTYEGILRVLPIELLRASEA